MIISRRKRAPSDVHCHRFRLTLQVDMNGFFKLLVVPENAQKIEEFPKQLTENFTSKVPVIGFFDKSSVMCLWNDEKNEYEFADKWNGM